MEDFLTELRWRGFIHSATDGIEGYLRSNKVTGYIGFDPTAHSLHVGSLLPIMGLVHLQRSGHAPIAIAGGGTGMIGDPSGKTQERKLLSKQELETNVAGIKKQLSQFFDFNTKTNSAKLVNNAEWLSKLSFMDFLRDYGKHFSVNEMLAKDSVKNRIDQEQGISFTEFCYSLLQAYDYLVLYDRYKCTLQMGGSDQWGNIIAGIDLVRRLRGAVAHGIVFPLITTTTGVKFGKTEAGSVWLDPSLTSPYKFYQFWYNTDDRDVIQYLKFFTFLVKDKIDELDQSSKKSPEKREAQTTLAREVTKLVHGETALIQAVKASKIFFGDEITDVTEKELLDIFSDVPSVELPKNQLNNAGISIVDLLVLAKVSTSKGEARRLLGGGGVYLNNKRVNETEKMIKPEDAINEKFVILRKGIKNYFLVRIISG
ncbi:MAG TPA: tyrosine--tRNA ligase [Bacteroidota bacterium]|nr:tyrosine--tRNA ligase [Bacteroidota bacterium]